MKQIDSNLSTLLFKRKKSERMKNELDQQHGAGGEKKKRGAKELVINLLDSYNRIEASTALLQQVCHILSLYY